MVNGVRATLRLTEDLYKKAMVKASSEGIYTFSEITRKLLREYVNES